jgi:hypothetical protein
MFDSIFSCTVWTIDPFSSQLRFSILVSKTNRSVRTLAMLDSSATAVFINKRFVSQHNILCCPLTRPIALHNIDGFINKAGSLTHFVCLTMNINSKYTEKLHFLITDLSPEDIILELPWLRRINPKVDWDTGTMELPDSPEPNPLPDDSPFEKISANCATRRTWIKAGIISETTDELWCCAGFTLSTELAAKANEAKAKKTFKQMVPKEYHKYFKVFSEVDLHCLPQHRPWDHAIDLKLNALETLKSKVYPIPHNEQGAHDKFIEEQLAKGYIVPSKSPMASPVFFVIKKNGELRLIQDYRKLNDITIKNCYLLPLAADIINWLQDAKIFTKFNVHWGYHNVRIRRGDEWKAAFVTNQGLFKPKVMFFGLTNSPTIFHSLMNSIFADLIAQGKVAGYFDDILIWSSTLKEHRKIVHKVLHCLQIYDLYLHPEKCEFEQTKVDYLGLVISHGKVSMDPVKIEAVVNWPIPESLKEVRSFIGFANFYRRFIKDFSKI